MRTPIIALSAFALSLCAACEEEPLPAYAPGSDGLLVMEAENFDTLSASRGKSWVLEAPRGFVGAGALKADPDLGDRFDTDYAGHVPHLSYSASFTEPGKYFVWVRGYAPNEEGRSVHVGLDGEASEDASRIVIVAAGRYEWTGRRLRGERAFVEVPSAGVHDIDVWMREDGFIVDRLLLTSAESYADAQGDALGPPESVRGGGEQPCGNGRADEGEPCDGDTCCTTVCSFEEADTFCGDAAAQQLCQTPEVCSGASATCGSRSAITGCTCVGAACTMTIEAEDATRVEASTYVADTTNASYVRIPDGATEGTLSTRFAGPSGTYLVELVLGRESDGQPELTLSIGGAQIRRVLYPRGATELEPHTVADIPPQQINYGDLIVLSGKAKAAAWARVDKIVIKTTP